MGHRTQSAPTTGTRSHCTGVRKTWGPTERTEGFCDECGAGVGERYRGERITCEDCDEGHKADWEAEEYKRSIQQAVQDMGRTLQGYNEGECTLTMARNQGWSGGAMAATEKIKEGKAAAWNGITVSDEAIKAKQKAITEKCRTEAARAEKERSVSRK